MMLAFREQWGVLAHPRDPLWLRPILRNKRFALSDSRT